MALVLVTTPDGLIHRLWFSVRKMRSYPLEFFGRVATTAYSARPPRLRGISYILVTKEWTGIGKVHRYKWPIDNLPMWRNCTKKFSHLVAYHLVPLFRYDPLMQRRELIKACFDLAAVYGRP